MKTENLKVMVLGYGSREHALAAKIKQSPRVAEVFVAPGNAGTAQIGTNVPISDEDVDGLLAYALENQIDLTVVGTNDPLAFGVVDAFEDAGLAIFGPRQGAAQLESSKAFAKDFMDRHGILTPAFATFTTFEEADAYLDIAAEESEFVVKVSGLGKMGMGVSVCDTRAEAKQAIRRYMLDNILGEAAETIVIEERLHGHEVSIFALCDGEVAVPLMPVRDYKRIYDNDEGPNTGGVGAYGPPPDVDDLFVAEIMATVMQPTIKAMAAEGNPYKGVLYAGVMVTEQGNYILEFNCRFGNPEALVITALLESDLVDIMEACIEGGLTPDHVQLREGAAAAVVMTSGGYPSEDFAKGFPITGIGAAESLDDVEVYHHGTICEEGQVVTSRGRVIAVSAYAEDVPSAVERVYEGLERISFEGAHYRRDVAAFERA